MKNRKLNVKTLSTATIIQYLLGAVLVLAISGIGMTYAKYVTTSDPISDVARVATFDIEVVSLGDDGMEANGSSTIIFNELDASKELKFKITNNSEVAAHVVVEEEIDQDTTNPKVDFDVSETDFDLGIGASKEITVTMHAGKANVIDKLSQHMKLALKVTQVN